MFQLTPVVKILLIINIGFYLASLAFGAPFNEMMSLYYFESEKFQIHQLLTHFFMHGSFIHILFNMIGLVLFGSYIENFWGKQKFIILYFVCAFGAAAIHTGADYYKLNPQIETIQSFKREPDANTFSRFFTSSNESILSSEGHQLVGELESELRNGDNPKVQGEAINLMNQVLGYQLNIPIVGASGAIYGIFVAFGILFPNNSLMFLFFPVPIKAKYLIPALLCYDAVFGFNPMPGDFTGHFAHLGGAVFGIILTLYWTRNNNNYQVN